MRTRSPSVKAMQLASGPSSRSSTMTFRPASPWAPPTSIARSASSASIASAQTTTPFPAARPSAFTTTFPPRARA